MKTTQEALATIDAMWLQQLFAAIHSTDVVITKALCICRIVKVRTIFDIGLETA